MLFGMKLIIGLIARELVLIASGAAIVPMSLGLIYFHSRGKVKLAFHAQRQIKPPVTKEE
jgi:hypothetical protein